MIDGQSGAVVPIDIITGFLGSGKTTFLNSVLADPRLRNTAIIVNEFGEVGLDHVFLEAAGEPVLEIAGGCMCCQVRGKIVDTLRDLPLRSYERVVIETSGLADPAPLLRAIRQDPELGMRFSTGRVIVLVDARTALYRDKFPEEMAAQIALADEIVITRVEELENTGDAGRLGGLHARLQQLAPVADLHRSVRLQRPADLLLRQSAIVAPREPGDIRGTHGLSEIASAVLAGGNPWSPAAIEEFFGLLADRTGPALLRLKGLIEMESAPTPTVVHCSVGLFDQPRLLRRWPDTFRQTRMVAIAKRDRIGEVRRLFDAFAGISGPDTPDVAAIVHNPLAFSPGD